MEKLVGAEWLHDHIDQPDIVVLDCTVDMVPTDDGAVNYVSGEKSHADEHIPSARFADLVGSLSASGSKLMFAMPEPAVFCEEMRSLGVSNTSRVILYDRSITAWAARVWWMLRWVGFDHAALLDGGLQSWKSEGFDVEAGSVSAPRGDLSLDLRQDAIANQEEVRTGCQSDQLALIDTLSEASFRGDENAHARPGHIAGASNVFTLDLFDKDGKFLPLEQLATLHGGDKSKRQVTYCGAGILASANAFTLLRLGFDDVALYAASLQEWAADERNPMEAGAESV